MRAWIVLNTHCELMNPPSESRSDRTSRTDRSEIVCNTPRKVTQFQSVATIRSNFRDSEVPFPHTSSKPQLRSSVTPPILMPASFERRVERKSTVPTELATPKSPSPKSNEQYSTIPPLNSPSAPPEDRRTNLNALKTTYLRAATASDLRAYTDSTDAALLS